MTSGFSHERERTILTLWEHGAGLDRFAREDALLAAGGLKCDGLGARNAALVAMRAALFDRIWPLRSRCPMCATECSFDADSQELAQSLEAYRSAPAAATMELGGRQVRLRAPTVDDLRAAASASDTGMAARVLLDRCADPIEARTIDDETIATLARRLEQLDPGAIVSFDLQCPECAHAWSAPIDIGAAVWAEVRRSAEMLLLDIDLLARTYGWAEDDILHLSAIRRAAYVQLAGAS